MEASQANHRPVCFLFWFLRENELMELGLGWTPKLLPPSRPDPLRRQAVAGATAPVNERCTKALKRGPGRWWLLWLTGGPIKRGSDGL
jgi:hypothetical protein